MVSTRTPILIVDDDDGNLKALKRCLEKEYPIVLSSDPREALDKVKKETYSVIICDLKMPHLTGVDFLKLAGELQPLASRILLTAYSDPKDILAAINHAEVYRYLTKPWEVPELIETVKMSYQRFEKLAALALTDALTEIWNRRGIFLKMNEEKLRADRYQRPFCIGMLDLDDFKKYNDSKGHLEGDNALKAVAKQLSTSLRKIDAVGRYGGEEFLILLPETKLKVGLDICERLRSQIEKNCPIKASIGVACFPDHAKDLEKLVDQADKALYQAKHQGKNRVSTLNI